MNEINCRRSTQPDHRVHLFAICGFLLSLAAGLLVPVYTDEIGWRFQERAGYDGVDIMINDLCGPNTIARPPLFMMPLRWFSAAVNQSFADPLFVRIEGLICAFGWVALLWMLIVRLESDKSKRRNLQALVFAILGLGTLPYLLVLSRPEQPLILTLTLMILTVFARAPALSYRTLAWLKVSAVVLLATIGASYHMKGVAYAPVAFACIAGCAKGRESITPRLAGAAALGAIMLAAMYYWVGRFQCMGDAKMAGLLAKENIASVIANHGQLKNFLSQLIRGANPLNYVWLAAPINNPMSSWLPADLFPPVIPPVVNGVMTVLWAGIALLAFIALTRFLCREKMRGLAEPRALLALAIIACVLVWGASQVQPKPYEASHVLPMLAVFAALCLTLAVPEIAWQHRVLGWLRWLAVPTALLSEVILLGYTGGPLLVAAQHPGYLDNQRFSVSIANYAGVRHDIDRAMAMAGIPHDRLLHRLLIDDVTYLALQANSLPLHRLGVVDVWNASIIDPAPYLVSRDSDGVVASCSNLPLHLEVAAMRSGGICAISRAALKQLAEPAAAIWADDLEPK